LLVAAELAAQQSAGERAPHQQPELFGRDERHDFTFEIATGKRVVALRRHDLGEVQALAVPQRAGHLPGRPVRDADIADQALPHESVEGREAFLNRGHGVGAVELVEVDVIDLEALQACLDAVENVPPRIAMVVRTRADRTEHLRCDHHVLTPDAQVLEGLTDNLLRRAV